MLLCPTLVPCTLNTFLTMCLSTTLASSHPQNPAVLPQFDLDLDSTCCTWDCFSSRWQIYSHLHPHTPPSQRRIPSGEPVQGLTTNVWNIVFIERCRLCKQVGPVPQKQQRENISSHMDLQALRRRNPDSTLPAGLCIVMKIKTPDAKQWIFINGHVELCGYNKMSLFLKLWRTFMSDCGCVCCSYSMYNSTPTFTQLVRLCFHCCHVGFISQLHLVCFSHVNRHGFLNVYLRWFLMWLVQFYFLKKNRSINLF